MNVLIVDDVPTNGIVIKGMMKKVIDSGPDISNSPMEALGLCAVKQYDLIIVDHFMPELNGCEFAKRLRAQQAYRTTPIFMVTSSNEVSVCVEAFKSGVTDFLSKPFKLEEFRERLTKHLNDARQRQLIWEDED